MIRSAIRTLARKELGETTASFWTDVQINTWINDACSDIAFRTKCLRSTGFITITENVPEYTLSSSLTGIIEVLEAYFYVSGLVWEPLTRKTREQMNTMYPGWKMVGAIDATSGLTVYTGTTNSGVPTMYIWDREEGVFTLHVPPDSENSGANYCQIYYARDTVDLSTASGADGSTSDLPKQLHFAAVDYVVATGQSSRGWQDRANDTWYKYFQKLHDYQVERQREKEDVEIIMVPQQNLRRDQ